MGRLHDLVFDIVFDGKKPAQAPDLVYHYTSLKSVLSIIESGQLWASYITQMQDKEEYFHALNSFAKAAGFINSLSHKTLRDCLIERTTVALVNRDEPEQFIYPLFVSSFSYARNDPELWQKHADNGKGVCIGFDNEKLSNCARSFQGLAYQMPVIYDNTKQQVLLQSLVNFILREYDFSAEARADTEEWVGILTEAMSHIAPLFKRGKDFAWEKEWRFVRRIRTDIRTLYDESGNTLADEKFLVKTKSNNSQKYVEIKFESGALPIACIDLLENEFSNSHKKDLSLALSQSSYGGVQINCLNIDKKIVA